MRQKISLFISIIFYRVTKNIYLRQVLQIALHKEWKKNFPSENS